MMNHDDNVSLNYPVERFAADDLILGDDSRLRSGTIVYAGSRIGSGFTTGHNVIVREECDIADDVSIWSNTIIDYGVKTEPIY